MYAYIATKRIFVIEERKEEGKGRQLLPALHLIRHFQYKNLFKLFESPRFGLLFWLVFGPVVVVPVAEVIATAEMNFFIFNLFVA